MVGAGSGDAQRHVGHVQRAGDAIQHAHGDQEERRADQVEHHVVQPGTHAILAATVQQQRVGRDQQNLEEHEQVEQVAGEERPVDTQQLELEQRMEVATALVVATHRVEHREQRQHRCHHQHQRTEAVQYQHDAERRLPVTQGIDLNRALVGQRQQPEAQRHQQCGHADRQHALARHVQASGHQQQAAGQQRQKNGKDQRMIHRCCSRPSTWSVLSSPTLRRASTTTNAVMAKPMTMAVSTSAWGSGST